MMIRLGQDFGRASLMSLGVIIVRLCYVSLGQVMLSYVKLGFQSCQFNVSKCDYGQVMLGQVKLSQSFGRASLM